MTSCLEISEIKSILDKIEVYPLTSLRSEMTLFVKQKTELRILNRQKLQTVLTKTLGNWKDLTVMP